MHLIRGCTHSSPPCPIFQVLISCRWERWMDWVLPSPGFVLYRLFACSSPFFLLITSESKNHIDLGLRSYRTNEVPMNNLADISNHRNLIRWNSPWSNCKGDANAFEYRIYIGIVWSRVAHDVDGEGERLFVLKVGKSTRANSKANYVSSMYRGKVVFAASSVRK